MVILICRCSYEWNYKGKKENGHYVNCPTCMYKVRVVNKEVEAE